MNWNGSRVLNFDFNDFFLDWFWSFFLVLLWIEGMKKEEEDDDDNDDDGNIHEKVYDWLI